MKPQLLTFGESESRVVIIDSFSGMAGHIRQIAAAMAPYPPAEGTYYPGIRRFITAEDTAAFNYTERLMQEASQFIGGAFDIDEFDLLEASFSMITRTPASLSSQQRAPHFDDSDPKYLAVLHYLSPTSGTGTAFYRHRATGIERVTPENAQTLIEVMKKESAGWSSHAYIHGSNPWFEQIGEIEAIPDRLAIYQGALLHSGIIPPDMAFSTDPLIGRLTANLFVLGK